MVWPYAIARLGPAAEESDRSGKSDQRADFRTLRRQRYGNPDCANRADARRTQGCGQAIGDRDLSRRRSRLQRRLSSQLQSASRQGRMETDAGLVQRTWRSLKFRFATDYWTS